MSDWISNIYNSLIVAGIIIVICTIGSSNKSGLTGTIIGYSFILAGILLLVGILMNKMNETAIGISFWNMLYTIGPFILIIGIIICLISLLSIYFNLIASGNVTSNYYIFMNIFVALFIGQMWLFYTGIQDKKFITSHSLSKVISMSIYLLETVSIITLITLGIILKYFVTDG